LARPPRVDLYHRRYSIAAACRALSNPFVASHTPLARRPNGMGLAHVLAVVGVLVLGAVVVGGNASVLLDKVGTTTGAILLVCFRLPCRFAKPPARSRASSSTFMLP